ncbi:MAG: hypothetical protein ACR2M1_06495 [Gemmatimonadaceae bacterium]
MTTAAFFQPSPALMHGWVLALLTVAPTIPALARMPIVQAATAVLGLWHTNTVALLIATLAACGMMVLVGQHDRRASVSHHVPTK